MENVPPDGLNTGAATVPSGTDGAVSVDLFVSVAVELFPLSQEDNRATVVARTKFEKVTKEHFMRRPLPEHGDRFSLRQVMDKTKPVHTGVPRSESTSKKIVANLFRKDARVAPLGKPSTRSPSSTRSNRRN